MSQPRSRRRVRRIIKGHDDPETLARLRLEIEADLDAMHDLFRARRRDCEGWVRSPGRQTPPAER